jgi:protein-glutamine gamma-glutamyltransferase
VTATPNADTAARRLLAALPLLVAAGALGSAAAWPLALALGVLILAAARVGPRWEVDLGRQLLSSVIGAALGYVLTSLSYEAERGRLSDGWAKLAAAMLIAAAVRALLVAPRGGAAASFALAFAGLTFAGKTQATVYPALVVSFLASGLWVLGGGSLRVGPRRTAVAMVVLALAAAMALAANFGLKRLHAWAQSRVRHSTHALTARTGFSDRMDLGSLDGLLDSKRRVLRVRGTPVDYLRGAVFDVYEVGRWRRSALGEKESLMRLDAPRGAGETEINAISGQLNRFFVPLDARGLRTRPGQAQVDAFGALRPDAKQKMESVRFVTGARDLARAAEPGPFDLSVPRRLAQRLTPLAAEWTRGANTPSAKLRAIAAHLTSEFEYAREFSRAASADPILDFLFVNRRGHCEYFASALVLLARAAGIPARVVMGYRVSEKSPFGYYVVRERNAHAWAETWLPGQGWTTEDATPAAAQPSNRPEEASYVTSSLDALAVAYDDATDWLARRSLIETSLAWVAGCLMLALIVARGVRRRAKLTQTRKDDEALLPFMQPLLATLERQGHTRRPDESLEQLAARLPDPEVAGLLARYSALRYGGIGDRERLARDVTAGAAALRRRE